MLVANVLFFKDAERDNFTEGCSGNRTLVHEEKFTVEFMNTHNLIQKLCDWATSNFDISASAFMEYTNNECENNRFDYCQSEDNQGNQMDITEENPDGYLASYTFLITDVSQKIDDYVFDEVSN